MAGPVRRWLTIGACGAILGASLVFGSAAVSADANTAQMMGQTECTRAGKCPKPDEFGTGIADTGVTGPADTTTDDSGTNTPPPDSSGG